jgi:xanthosine utilization system XapX-like protein
MSQGLVVRVVLSVAAGVAVVIALIALQPPAWIVLLLGSMALAGLYIYEECIRVMTRSTRASAAASRHCPGRKIGSCAPGSIGIRVVTQFS